MTGPGSVEDGRVPRMVEVEAARDLVDGAAVGDTVQVVGVVCTMDVGGGGGPPRDQLARLGSSITNLYVAVARISRSEQRNASMKDIQAIPSLPDWVCCQWYVATCW